MSEDKNTVPDFTSYIQKDIKTLAECIKTSSILPVGSARNNFNACFPTFTAEMKPHRDRVLNMVSTLLVKEGMKQNVEHCDTEEKIDLVVDGVNKILDRVRDNLSILNGTKKVLSTGPMKMQEKYVSGSWNKDHKKSVVWKTNDKRIDAKPLHLQKISEKPQSKFEVKIDNSNSPFKPNLQLKYNAIKPLAIYLERDVDGFDHYCHPYIHELNCFKVPEEQLIAVMPVKPSEIDSNRVVYVADEKSLAYMMKDLENEKELAVDLEYHSYRSFQGFTCLMQISTRKTDYIIDAIALRSKLHVLNKVFTDPLVVKVFHGANSDIVWLQKDFNLYVVNMFDTHLASMALDFPRLSLAFLLKHYCNVDADKRYQLYDWRIRPLPEAAMTYARSDTHYLLYIYDELRNALLEKANETNNLLQSVYARSTELCKKRYEKVFDENSHLTLYKQSKQSFDNRQMHALKLLYQWRDGIAREQDESTGYVLPNHMLLQVAEILPREMQGILACCSPVPSLVRQHLPHLHHLIMEARNQPVNKMSTNDSRASLLISKIPMLSKLRCPHDFSHHDDFRDNLATLLDGTDVINLTQEKAQLRLSVLESVQNEWFDQPPAECGTHLKNYKSVTFVSPYERYKKTVDFVLAQETEENCEVQNSSQSKKDDIVKKAHPELEENVPIFKLRSTEAKTKKEPNCKTSDVKRTSDVELTDNKTTSISTSTSSSNGNRQKPLAEQVPNKKLVECYEVAAAVSSPATGLATSDTGDAMCIMEHETCDSNVVNAFKKVPEASSKIGKKRKGNRKGNNVEKQPGSFTPFDYSQASYSKFVSAGPKNLKKLLSSKITFGAKKKHAKRQKFQKKKTTK